jgi:hypothetical protein
MRSTHLRLVAATAAAAVLAGCGASSSGELSGQSAASDRGMIHFARCMRAHGINVPDPIHRPGHAGVSVEVPGQGPATTDAYKACGQYLKATIALKEQAAQRMITPAIRLALTRYAECMRTHDVPMLDPDTLGQLNLGRVPGMANGFGRYTPQFHAADQDCRHLLPASVPDNGTGP